jgi:hypothetical protein
VLEKEQQSCVESSSICPVQTDEENHLHLESCSEQTEENEQTKNHEIEEQTESLNSESYTQYPLVLVGEDTGIEAKEFCVDYDISPHTSLRGSDPVEHQEQVSGSSESEVQARVCTESPPEDFLTCPPSDIEHQPMSSPLDEVSDNTTPVVSDERTEESLIVESTDWNNERTEESLTVESTDLNDSAVNTETFAESPKMESSEGETAHGLDRHCVPSSDTELPEHIQTENTEIIPACEHIQTENTEIIPACEHIQTENTEIIPACGTSENENSHDVQDCEDNLLKHKLDNSQSDKFLEERTESLSGSTSHPFRVISQRG